MPETEAAPPRVTETATERPGQPRRVARAAALLVGVAVAIFIVGVLVGLAIIGRHGGGPIQGWDDSVGRWYLHHRG